MAKGSIGTSCSVGYLGYRNYKEEKPLKRKWWKNHRHLANGLKKHFPEQVEVIDGVLLKLREGEIDHKETEARLISVMRKCRQSLKNIDLAPKDPKSLKP